MAVAATPLATNLIGQDADIASSASSAVPGRWRLLYFDAPTRGEQVRLLFTAAKVDFDDEKLDYPRREVPVPPLPLLSSLRTLLLSSSSALFAPTVSR
jgi:hypothetical protein